MNEQTKDFFHSYSGKFNAIYGSNNNMFRGLINKLFRKSMLMRYNKTLQSCQPIAGKSVLDLGCGPGHYCIALAKQGASDVLGIDFAPNMLDIAREQAAFAGVYNVCRFENQDFLLLTDDKKFDYTILMGFMDYMVDPLTVINKALLLTKEKAVFSFPSDSGFLAWQRKLRYHNRCPLYLYNEAQIKNMFTQTRDWKCSVEKISRDYFVTLERIENETI